MLAIRLSSTRHNNVKSTTWLLQLLYTNLNLLTIKTVKRIKVKYILPLPKQFSLTEFHLIIMENSIKAPVFWNIPPPPPKFCIYHITPCSLILTESAFFFFQLIATNQHWLAFQSMHSINQKPLRCKYGKYNSPWALQFCQPEIASTLYKTKVQRFESTP